MPLAMSSQGPGYVGQWVLVSLLILVAVYESQSEPAPKSPTKRVISKRQAASLSSTACDFAAHYVTDNADFFMDRTDGLFGEDWTFDNGCENHPLGCCLEDEDCKCYGIIEEMDEELEIPPICYPLRPNMPAPQFCMRK